MARGGSWWLVCGGLCVVLESTSYMYASAFLTALVSLSLSVQLLYINS